MSLGQCNGRPLGSRRAGPRLDATRGGHVEFSSDVITLEVEDHIATLWLDREEARNAMGSVLWRDLLRATSTLAADTSVRALVIAARGPHFCVGLDLKEASRA